MLRLDAARTAQHLPYRELVPAIARAAGELAQGTLHAPERLATCVADNATLLCMPAVAADISITKLVTVHGDNAARGLPTIHGEVVVFETASGRRIMLLDGPTVTARRTAATTLLAIDTLARRRPASALIIGTGAQATAHVDALVEYLNVRSLWIAGEDRARARDFSSRVRYRHAGVNPIPLAAAELDPAGCGTDVVIAVTTARSPVVPENLPDSTLAIGVGAFRPDMAELPPELLRRRRIMVDYLPAARREAGDLLQADVDWHQVSELAEGARRASEHDGPGWVFKSVGHASWDLAAARVALRSHR
jgi:1-piperideine-2-carboxylate/1-pyrroline-2-carboxylate reductase [NAD(P)H]